MSIFSLANNVVGSARSAMQGTFLWPIRTTPIVKDQGMRARLSEDPYNEYTPDSVTTLRNTCVTQVGDRHVVLGSGQREDPAATAKRQSLRNTAYIAAQRSNEITDLRSSQPGLSAKDRQYLDERIKALNTIALECWYRLKAADFRLEYYYPTPDDVRESLLNSTGVEDSVLPPLSCQDLLEKETFRRVFCEGRPVPVHYPQEDTASSTAGDSALRQGRNLEMPTFDSLDGTNEGDFNIDNALNDPDWLRLQHALLEELTTVKGTTDRK